MKQCIRSAVHVLRYNKSHQRSCIDPQVSTTLQTDGMYVHEKRAEQSTLDNAAELSACVHAPCVASSTYTLDVLLLHNVAGDTTSYTQRLAPADFKPQSWKCCT